MSQPWTIDARARRSVATAAIVTLVEGPAFCISLASGDMAPGSPARPVLPRHAVPLGAAAPRQRAAARAARRDHRSTRSAPCSCCATTRGPGLADSAAHGLPQPLRRTGHARGHRRCATTACEPALCALEFSSAADFADLFEVKEGRVEKLGDLTVHVGERPHHVRRTGAARFSRGAHLDFSEPRDVVADARDLRGRSSRRAGAWSTCLQVTPVIDDEDVTPRYLCGQPVERSTPVGAPRGVAAQPAGDRRPTTTASPRCSTAPPRTSPRCASSIPSIPDRPSSPPARRGS